MTPLQVLQQVLSDPENAENVRPLCSPDFKYVSLNYENADLKKILPWAGTHAGYEGITETFKGVNTYWTRDSFEPHAGFDDGENVALFGSFTLRSKNLDKSCVSPFAVYAKVKDGKLTYMQYMEDTFGTTSTFITGGNWTFKVLPDKAEFEV